jgi:S-adenosylmethionine decarboxylase
LLPKKETYSILINSYGTIVDVLMESKGGKKSSSSSNLMYEAPLGYKIEDVRPAGGIKKFQSAAYSNVRTELVLNGILIIDAFHTLVSNAYCLVDLLFCSAPASHPDIPSHANRCRVGFPSISLPWLAAFSASEIPTCLLPSLPPFPTLSSLQHIINGDVFG